MIRTIACLVSICTSCISIQAEERSSLWDSLRKQFEGKVLVNAKVVKIEKHGKESSTSTLKVIHVYLNRAIFDVTFVNDSREEASHGGSGGGFIPPLEVNQEGIWLLRKNDKGEWGPIYYPYLGVQWPVIANSSPRYAQAQALAETMEKVMNAPSIEQLGLLKENAFSKIPEVSAWAIRSLADCHATGVDKYLNEIITDPKLSLIGQLTVDEKLAEQPGSEWIGAKKRLTLQEKWVTSKMAEYETSRLISALDLTYQRKKIDGGVLIHLLDLFVHNSDVPAKERRDAIFFAGRTYKSSNAKEKVFSFLLEQIEHAKEKDLRSGAAYTMRNSIPLNEKQRGIVSELKKKVSDPEISAILDNALRGIQDP